VVGEQTMTSTNGFKEQLTATNSRMWFSMMRAHLESKELDNAIEENFVMPPPEAAHFERSARMVKLARAEIKLALNYNVHGRLMESTTDAKSLWTGLVRWATTLEEASLMSVLQDWDNLKKSENETMHDFLERAENMYHRLAPHRNFQVREPAACAHVGMRLPDAYKNYKHIFIASGYPQTFADLSKVLIPAASELELEEKKEKRASVPALFAGRDRGGLSGCFVCGGDHFARFCPKKVGRTYEAGPSSECGGLHKQRAPTKCTWCGKLGHYEDICFQKRDGRAKTVEEKTDAVALTLIARTLEFNPSQVSGPSEATPSSGDISGSNKATHRKLPSILERYITKLPDTASSRKRLQQLGLLQNYVPKSLSTPVIREEPSDSNPWWLDSGSKYHITGDRSVLHDYRTLSEDMKILIEVGNGNVLPAEGYGNVIPTRASEIVIEHVFYVPGFKHNLVSVSVLLDKGFDVLFQGQEARVTRGNISIIATRCQQGLFKFMTSASEFASNVQPSLAHGLMAKTPDAEVAGLWHRRLGHLGLKNMKRLVHEGMVTGLDVTTAQLRQFEGHTCEPCILGKSCREPFPTSETVTERPLQLVHLDVCGPLPASTMGHQYFVTMLDDFSGASLVQALKHKSDVADFIERGVALMQVQSKATLQCIRTDGGGEFVNNRVKEFCAVHGVRHETSAPYTPQQNGKAERLNRTLLEKVRSMLADSAVPKEYWHEALSVASFVRNRSPVSGKSKTPFESMTGVVPDVSLLRVFGCDVFVHVPKVKCDKLDPRASKGTFLGYEPNSKAYRILAQDGRIIVSRDVQFHECKFKYRNNEVQPDESQVGTIASSSGFGVAGASATVVSSASDAAGAPVEEAGEAGVGSPGLNPIIPAAGAPVEEADEAGLGDEDIPPPLVDSEDAEEEEQDDEEEDEGSSENERNTREDDDDLSGSGSSGSNSRGGTGRNGGNDSPPPAPRKSAREKKTPFWSSNYVMLSLSSEVTDEPKSLQEAQARSDWPQWKAAMDEEMTSLHENRTWELEEIPPGAQRIGLKWVFKL